jgi:hypothetical protein
VIDVMMMMIMTMMMMIMMKIMSLFGHMDCGRPLQEYLTWILHAVTHP